MKIREVMLCAVLEVTVTALGAEPPASITIGYPEEGSIFPPDFAVPTFHGVTGQWKGGPPYRRR